MKRLALIPLLFLNGCVTGALLNQYDMNCYSRTYSKDDYRQCVFEQQAQAEAESNRAITQILERLSI